MLTFETKTDIHTRVRDWQRAGNRVALVPTMGSLHDGHLSLVRLARRHADKVVVSIFVNPTQFAPGEDFAAYPRDEAGDLARCAAGGVDAVFLPSPDEMYPPDATITITESTLSKTLCGQSRPTHFQGVLTVVNKLFNITRADAAVFGMKDAQQLAVIRRMVRDLDLAVEIIAAPIVREPDGLAMSSRNAYLSPGERRQARCLRQALDLAEAAWSRGETGAAPLLERMRGHLEQTPGAEVDYLAAVDADTLAPVERLRPGILIALAVRMGRTRLIDNTLLPTLPS